jgi:hypothetical protein
MHKSLVKQLTKKEKDLLDRSENLISTGSWYGSLEAKHIARQMPSILEKLAKLRKRNNDYRKG